MLRRFQILFCTLLLLFCTKGHAEPILLGIDVLVSDGHLSKLKNKKIGIVTNQSGVNSKLKPTIEILKEHTGEFKIVALFAPEHGFYGKEYASDSVAHDKTLDGIPIYSLHGETRRPTAAMLKGIDYILFDIQDIGSRSYTYISTLCYVMEEAAKKKIPVMVLDRPNPINGITCDGPMLDDGVRSIVGYVNVPYCHGMTVGELATYFNEENKLGCALEVIPMKGWRRGMSFRDTNLAWIPTSPNIPEADTPLYYPITGFLGELGIVNIGIGYTLPFKLVGAPWINAFLLSDALNARKLPGVLFTPFFFRPFYGKYKGETCQGVLISVSQPTGFKPVATQFAIIDSLKKLYNKEFMEAVKASGRKEMFTKVVGTPKAWELLTASRSVAGEFAALHEKERRAFLEKRTHYLNPAYSPKPSISTPGAELLKTPLTKNSPSRDDGTTKRRP